MNMPSGAGETDEVATTLTLAMPALLSQVALMIFSVSGAPVTGGNTGGALTSLACGQSVERKIGFCIGAPQGAGVNWPTTGEAVPGPSSGPEPQ